MITCSQCGNDNAPGTAKCLFCGQDLLNPTVIPGVAKPAMAGIGSPISAVSVLIPIDRSSGTEDPTRAIQLPSGYFNFLVGRTDLGQRPPIKPQIDLEVKYPDLVSSPDGYIVSRKAGFIRRDPLTEEVFFQTHPDSGSIVIIRSANDTVDRQLLPGAEDILAPGTVLSIGSRNSYIEFVVR